jgi:hypothetical protein
VERERERLCLPCPPLRQAASSSLWLDTATLAERPKSGSERGCDHVMSRGCPPDRVGPIVRSSPYNFASTTSSSNHQRAPKAKRSTKSESPPSSTTRNSTLEIHPFGLTLFLTSLPSPPSLSSCALRIEALVHAFRFRCYPAVPSSISAGTCAHEIPLPFLIRFPGDCACVKLCSCPA